MADCAGLVQIEPCRCCDSQSQRPAYAPASASRMFPGHCLPQCGVISLDAARRTIAPGSSELMSYRFAIGRNRFGAQLEPGTGGVVVITERLLTNNFR